MSKQQYRSEMGIMGDILDVTADGGRDGIIVSAISRKANLSHYAVLDKCEKLIEADVVIVSLTLTLLSSVIFTP